LLSNNSNASYTNDYIKTILYLMMFFWVWVPCGLADRSQRFGEAYCLHLHDWSDDARNQRDYIGWQEGKSEGKGQSGRSEVEIELGHGETPNLAQSLPHSILIGPFLQTFLPTTLYSPSDSQHRHFSPEDGDSTLLWNVGFYQPVHTAPKPRTISSILSLPWKPQISYARADQKYLGQNLL
jgi:hypothetical protein